MKLSDYSNLKEIHSLDNMIKTHLDTIEQERARIEHIALKREQKDKELADICNEKKQLELDISNCEVTLFDFEKRISSASAHLPMAKSEKEADALQKEIDLLSPKVDDLQNISLEKLDIIERLDSEIKKADQFLKGSKETLEEIIQEVGRVVKEQQVPIDQYNQRIDTLIESTPANLIKPFQEVRKKFRYNCPLVKIVNHACSFCHFRIDQMSLETVESLRGIETCGQCQRLFIPLES